jgi:hypothetical protein
MIFIPIKKEEIMLFILLIDKIKLTIVNFYEIVIIVSILKDTNKFDFKILEGK